MKRLMNSIKKFFFPPAGAPVWIRVLPYAVLGALTIFAELGFTMIISQFVSHEYAKLSETRFGCLDS